MATSILQGSIPPSLIREHIALGETWPRDIYNKISPNPNGRASTTSSIGPMLGRVGKPRGPRTRPPPPLPLKWPASTLVTHLLHWQSRSEEPIASVDRADYGILQHLCLVNEPPRRLLVPRCIPTSPPSGAC